eukprot:2190718-Rhodomonas_salina.3
MTIGFAAQGSMVEAGRGPRHRTVISTVMAVHPIDVAQPPSVWGARGQGKGDKRNGGVVNHHVLTPFCLDSARYHKVTVIGRGDRDREPCLQPRLENTVGCEWEPRCYSWRRCGHGFYEALFS